MIELDIPERRTASSWGREEIERRRKEWKAPPPRYSDGYGEISRSTSRRRTKGCDFAILRAATRGGAGHLTCALESRMKLRADCAGRHGAPSAVGEVAPHHDRKRWS